MKNKFIAGLLTLAILCTLNTSTVKAGDFIEHTTGAGPRSIPVECSIPSDFTIRLPASITLIKSGSNYVYDGNIGVKGDLAWGDSISVEPDSSVNLYDMTSRLDSPLPNGVEEANEQHKASKVANVTQAKQSWAFDELNTEDYEDVNLNITATDLGSATWKGVLKFEIGYIHYVG